MKTPFKSWFVRALALLMAASVAFAQDRVPFRQEELDQMLAPVALYPDSLLSQVLMASTYPLEVVQAARWLRANPELKGQDAVRAVENMDWDPSVKSLTAFPQVLSMMGEKLEWTQRLGEAFLAQQADVMDSVQALRRRAEAAGNLRSNEQMRVSRQGEVITIQQPAPEIVYVPYYNPVIAYGPWWWPAYPPVYWAPPRAFYVVPAHRPVFLWGPGIVISANFFFGRPDWHRRYVTVVHHYHATIVNRGVAAASAQPAMWRHGRAVSRNDGRVRLAAQPETRGAQPKAVTPVIRPDPRPAIRAERRPEPRPAANAERHVPRAPTTTRASVPPAATMARAAAATAGPDPARSSLRRRSR